MSTFVKKIPSFFFFLSKFSAIYNLPRSHQTWQNINLDMLNPTRISMPGGRAGTTGASYERTRREQESQEDREATLDRQRLRTYHLTPRQSWVPQLYKIYVMFWACTLYRKCTGRKLIYISTHIYFYKCTGIFLCYSISIR